MAARSIRINVGGIAFAVVVAFVEGQKVGVAFVEFGGHPDFFGVYGQVDDAAGKLEQRLSRIAVFFVLLSGVVGGLPCPGVFEFQGGHGNAVEEQHHIYR